MASTKLTFGAILNTVTSTASALTSTVSAIGTGATMLEAYATKAADEQRYQYSQDVIGMQQRIDTNIARDIARSVIEINKEKQKDPAFAEAFDHFYKLLEANRK